MWSDLEKGFQIAFENAWEAYRRGAIPIGVAIMDKAGRLMATGQNQIDADGEGILKFHQIAHAEVNAILKLSEITDQSIGANIRTFTLYSTMEPCPLCFGAIVMGSIRNVKYAARDNFAGATSLNTSIDYIKNKGITVAGPFEEPEIAQIAMQVCYELQRDSRARDVLLPSWRKVCEKGVLLGECLHKNRVLQDMVSREFAPVYDFIVSMEA